MGDKYQLEIKNGQDKQECALNFYAVKSVVRSMGGDLEKCEAKMEEISTCLIEIKSDLKDLKKSTGTAIQQPTAQNGMGAVLELATKATSTLNALVVLCFVVPIGVHYGWNFKDIIGLLVK